MLLRYVTGELSATLLGLYLQRMGGLSLCAYVQKRVHSYGTLLKHTHKYGYTGVATTSVNSSRSSSGQSEVSLYLGSSWFDVKPHEPVYRLWAFFFKAKQLQSSAAERYVYKEVHAFSKAYGKNLRKSGSLASSQPFFFDVGGFVPVGWGFVEKPISGLFPDVARRPVSSQPLAILEAGFFFPVARLASTASLGLLSDRVGPIGRSLRQAGLTLGRARVLVSQRLSGHLDSRLSVLKVPTYRQGYARYRGLLAESRLLQFKPQGGAVREGFVRPRLSLVDGSNAIGYSNNYKLSANVRSGSLQLLKKKLFLTKPELLREGLRYNTDSFSARLFSRRRSLRAEASLRGFNLRSYPGQLFPGLRGVSVSGEKGRLGSRDSFFFNTAGRLSRTSGLFFRQPVVRYKPGLLRYWRAHRFSFQRLFSFFAASRQKRLTSVVSRVSRVASFSFFKSVELSLLHVAMCSKLSGLSSVTEACGFLAKAYSCVNGSRASNPYMQLYQGDVVSLLASFKSARMDLRAFGSRAETAPMAKLSLHVKATSILSNEDTPAYLEVDELTSSCIVLFEPQKWSDWNQSFIGHFPHITFKLYNWKYST